MEEFSKWYNANNENKLFLNNHNSVIQVAQLIQSQFYHPFKY